MFEKLNSITFEITNRCNLRCRICNIWRERQQYDLSLTNIQHFFRQINYLESVCLTGGEPFLHPQIKLIYRFLFSLFIQKRIRQIDISTNGYSQTILQFLKQNREYLKPLSLSISLDGLEEMHNLQREKKDAFAKTVSHILYMRKFNIPLRIKFVITKLNYHNLPYVYSLAKKIGCAFYPKLFEKVDSYYHRYHKFTDLTPDKKTLLSILKYVTIIQRNERENNPQGLATFALATIKKALKNVDFIKYCHTPACSLFITCQGKIYNCLYQRCVGDIAKWPVLDWEEYKKNIKAGSIGKCPKCLAYHGYLRAYNIPHA